MKKYFALLLTSILLVTSCTSCVSTAPESEDAPQPSSTPVTSQTKENDTVTLSVYLEAVYTDDEVHFPIYEKLRISAPPIFSARIQPPIPCVCCSEQRQPVTLKAAYGCWRSGVGRTWTKPPGKTPRTSLTSSSFIRWMGTSASGIRLSSRMARSRPIRTAA